MLNKNTRLIDTSVIELVLTNRCNLKCPDCAVAAWQAPDSRDMLWGHLRQWAEETKRIGHKWGHIKLFGGEPTLHPDWLSIAEFAYSVGGKNCDYTLCTNRVGNRKKLEKCPPYLKLAPADKNVDSIIHDPYFMAPVDVAPKNKCKGGCFRLHICGINLGVDGKYYPCAPGRAIDRVFKLGLGTHSLQDFLDTDWNEVLPQYCKLCGLYLSDRGLAERSVIQKKERAESYDAGLARKAKEVLPPDRVSPTWKKALDGYRQPEG